MEVLEFVVPVENNKALFVWNIEPSLTEAQIHAQLLSVFSAFGPLYLVKVFPNAPLHPPGFYALIKFYSAVQAAEAQRLTDGKTLFQSSQLKVKLSSKQTPAFMSGSSTPLSHTHCLELANHCLGFNGWTSEIITLKELTDEEDEGDGGGVRRLRMGCLLQLCFPQHLRSSRGAAVVEDTFSCTGADVVLQRRCRLHKLVREKALVQAFTTVLLILLGNGKVMVEVKQTSDQLLPDDTEGILQVNEFSCVEVPADKDVPDDDQLDFTVS
ncbi:RAD52 motif-containing protein 1 isoform X2 [Acanthochromis polyacanthus]|uniref:RAD52 motif-containing protein 1 isoform X1 n=1 Tax=Acanthochromis polyacanthus TaxID=80966 RepID=UPI002234A404|nr:RAD52 motif-containing protein 1 isoform X1 [Acanthochromis polyacanthus]XP_051797347.1 RAD52 motif-containing protein 1 isoform X1 [Acanthochromis polyacanthus]XP_051797348.1 RAD52 motif-containing protein 1 isoform X2 [Acanthochromis polyacanthus]